MSFKDLFSTRADLYARYRPGYPSELFDFIESVTKGREVGWDNATGSGQAAAGIAAFMKAVIATDASADQIARAQPHARITYRVASAYDSGLADASIDLVTTAQAFHWLDSERFYREVRRVVRPGGVIAVWGYADPVIDTEELDAVVRRYNRGTIEKYWQPERDILLRGYAGVSFPFDEIQTPHIAMEVHWTLPEFAGLLRTWSATAAYGAAVGADPVVAVERELERYWKQEERHTVRWPLFIRAGYVR